MLENIRENTQGTIAKVILGFVVLTFAIAGVGSYTNSVDTSVAQVNGEKISQQEFEQAYQSQKRRMQQQFGDMFDKLAADSNYLTNFRNGVLDKLINEKLLAQNADDFALRVSDERLKQTIRNMPEFQVDGKFDNNRYLALINQAGFLQSSDFRDYLKVEMTRRQLSQGLIATEFNLPYQEKLAGALQNQTRDIRYAIIKSAQFDDQVALTDQEVKNYYQENNAQFTTQEQVKVNYITLDLNTIAKSVEVSEQDLQTYYQDNISTYTQAERRKVSHILIEFGDDEAAAKAKAEALLAKINAGEDFAELAKQNSADSFSGEKGGDLDWIERGVMDEAFEKAAFDMKQVGDVSAVVKSSFGFHIIKLTGLQPETIKPMADVHDELMAKVRRDKAQDKYFEMQQELARVSFEYPDNLEDAAKAIGAEVHHSDWLKRSGNAAPFNEAKVIEAAFSDVVLTEHVNSDVIEVNDSQALVLHLNEYKEAKVKPLTDVKADIEKRLTTSKATILAQAKADELLASLQQGNDITDGLKALTSEFVAQNALARNDAKVERAIAQQAFVLAHPAEGKVSAATVTLSNGDLALVQLNAVNEGSADADANLAQQQTSQLAQSAFQSYIESLRAEASIKRKSLKAAGNS